MKRELYMIKIKKILFAFAAMIALTFGRACSRSAKLKHVWLCSCLLTALVACGNKQVAAPAEGNGASNEAAFKVAKNYFFNNGQEIPSSPKITTAEEFEKLFGVATTMGERRRVSDGTSGMDGKPTPIDFTKQFVLAIIMPVTNLSTEITPLRLEEQGDTLYYFYDAKPGEAQSYSTQPISLVILDKKYIDKEVVMINELVKDYYTALERYLTEQIAGYYAPGEYTVPLSDVVAVNEEDSTDIRLWGDFWVYNYKQVGDTLKCISGGSHPGLIHICKTGENFYVSRFDQVEDGSRYLPSAKRIFGEYFDSFQLHHSDADNREVERADMVRIFVRDHGLTATMYQDYGWPAKELK